MKSPRSKTLFISLCFIVCFSLIAHAQQLTPANETAPEAAVRVCCRPLPKWSGAKDWFELGLNRLVVEHLHHCYIELGETGAGSSASVYGKTSSIHPVAPHNDNKQPMPDQLTDSLTMGGECKKVADATPEKIERLREELATGTCPSCGENYHNRVLSGLYSNCNTYVFDLIHAAGMTPPKMSGVPGYRPGRDWNKSTQKKQAAAKAEEPRKKQFRGASTLNEFSRTANAKLLVYFNNENAFAVLNRGVDTPLGLKTHLQSPGACCAHRATPALSHDGKHLAFVRLASARPRSEVVSILDVETRAEREVFSAAMVWGISWSSDDDQLAVTADPDAPGQHALTLIEQASGTAKRLLDRGVEIDGARYNLSDYSPVSWNRDNTRLAIEFRRTGFGASNGSSGAIVLWDLKSGTFHKLSDGVEPSWSPGGDAVAFFDGMRQTCYLANADGGEKKLLFASTKGPLPAGRSPLVFPVAWSPDGTNLIFHEWVDADLAVNVYQLNLALGKATRVGKSELQVVAWR